MRLFSKDREAIRLARQLAMETGETITRAVIEAMRRGCNVLVLHSLRQSN